MLRERADRDPDQLLFQYLRDGEEVSATLTACSLDQSARRTAVALRERVKSGDRAVLIHSYAPDFLVAFFGCLYAGVVPIPVPVPHSEADQARLRGILETATPTVLLDEDAATANEPPAWRNGAESGLVYLSSAEAALYPASEWRPEQINSDSLAYLQYTSGSTSTPKGVMISHANVISNLAFIEADFRHSAESLSVSWLPHFHDMGLVYGLFHPIYRGFPCALMPPRAFIQSPLRWLAAISRFRATHSGGPNFAYDLCTRAAAEQRYLAIDLRSWRIAFNGAEPVRLDSLESFARAFAPSGFDKRAFYPAYGLAEATLKVSGGASATGISYKVAERDAAEGHEGAEEGRPIVGCGRAGSETRIVIVDSDSGLECAAGQIGEIWVSGAGVALGYWNEPDLTESIFRASLKGRTSETYLRTGDLGFIADGELFVTGRLKDLIIIRGQNYHPEDFELTVEAAHPQMRKGAVAVFGVDTADGQGVVVLAELQERKLDDTAMTEIGERVAEAIRGRHQTPLHGVVLLKRGALPRTTSGKLRRRECSQRFQSGAFRPLWIRTFDTVVEKTPVPHLTREDLNPAVSDRKAKVIEYLLGQLAAITKREIGELRINVSMVALGVDSLGAAKLAASLSRDLSVEISLARALGGSTIESLAEEVLNCCDNDRDPLAAEEWVNCAGDDPPGIYPLSYVQESIWAITRLNRVSAAYNISRAFRISQPLNLPAFVAALEELVERHSALRARILEGREPLREVLAHEPGAISFHQHDASQWSEEQVATFLREEARSPFRLESGPLIRFALLRRAAADWVAVFTAHHIIVDLRSFETLLHEFGVIYAFGCEGSRSPLSPIKAGYADYADRHRQLIAGTQGERWWQYWKDQLAGESIQLELPTDRARPAVQSGAGGARRFCVEPLRYQQLLSIGRQNGATPYVALLATYCALLKKLSGQKHVRVASPVSGVMWPEYAETVGHFVNPVVLSVDMDDDPTFATLVRRLVPKVLDGLERSAFPFRLLVERLAPERDASRMPLYQTMFAFQKSHRFDQSAAAPFLLGHSGGRLELGGLEVESVAVEQGTSQVDLSLTVAESGDGLLGALEFDSDLFDDDTATRMVSYFQNVIEQVCEYPDRPLSAITALDERQRRLVTVEWNRTFADYPGELCLHEFIERQIERTPDSVAVVFEDQEWTYGDLQKRSDRIARRLRALGVAPDTRVGVCMHRSFELIAGMLGILKAGAAYVPIAPDYPDDYLRFVIQDAGIDTVLTHEITQDRMASIGVSTLQADREDNQEPALEAESTNCLPANLAYVIYTSGSTGRPKGVMNTHQGICNRLLWMQEAFKLDAADRVLQKTPFTFDVSVWEFFWPLMTGARLVVARPDGHKDIPYLIDLIDRQKITTLHFVPSMLRKMLEAPDLTRCSTIARVISSGEALPVELQDRCLDRLPAALYNLYGPTEASVDVTWWRCQREPGKARVPIGFPIANTSMRILDDQMEPTPIGSSGEVYIGGVGLARGYVNRPDLTAERFGPDPHASAPGDRLYATGDIGRYRSSGAIEYIERADLQVKIRGFRIELEDVAAAIRQCAGVRDAVVSTFEENNGELALAAYVVPGDRRPEQSDLRSELARLVPAFMTPSVFVFLDNLPLTVSGKVDRRALPPPVRSSDNDRPFVGPRNPIEERVASIWAEVCKLPAVSVEESFYDLGGHSLLAVEIMTRLNEEFQLDLPWVLLLSGTPTVASMAEAVQDGLANQELDSP